MSKKPETVFRKKVTDYLKTLPGLTYFSIQQKAIQGHPDLILCVWGKFVAIELKAKDGKASQLQLYNIERIKKSGGYAFVIDPDNFKELKIFLNLVSKEGTHGNYIDY